MSRLKVLAICVGGVVFNAWCAWNLFVPGAASTGRNDFLPLYAFGQLTGSPNLYDTASVYAAESHAIGAYGIVYPRLPYYGLLLKPLTWMPYQTAYRVWEALMLAAFAGFVLLWPHARPAEKWILCCWSLPFWAGLFNGQDGALLLLWLALAMRLFRGGREVLVGAVLALCASKYNLVILVPLVILAQRRWRMAAGASAVGAVMLALSFLAAGASWPLRYWAMLMDPLTEHGLDHMANLHALFSAIPFGVGLEAAVALLIAATVFLAARRTADFEGPLALALAGSLLVSPHTYLADCALLLPALMFAAGRVAAGGPRRISSTALATPVPWYLLQLLLPLPAITRALMVGLVYELGGNLGVRWRRAPAKPASDLAR